VGAAEPPKREQSVLCKDLVKACGHQKRPGEDRRNDSTNSLMDVYGRWGAIASNGTVTWSGQIFRITTESFPPVYPGTLPANRDPGHYDPVWPPGSPASRLAWN
jgi:hypothetical protein